LNDPSPSHAPSEGDGTPGGRIFRRPHRVAFADVDAAGIVYYPRLLHYCHLTFEEFLIAAGAGPYPRWLQVERLGFPTVHLEVDFQRPVEFGAPLEMTARVERIGGKSVTFIFEGLREEDSVAFRARVVKACATMDGGEAREIPNALRRILSEYLVEGGPA